MEQTNTAAIKHYVGSTERAFAAHVNDLNGLISFKIL